MGPRLSGDTHRRYGTQRDLGTTGIVGGLLGYGWLGQKQRSSTDATAGLTLMGARLYNPTRGLFTTVDPVQGGNDSVYGYPTDPINMFDLDGKFGWRKWGRRALRASTYIPGAVGTVSNFGHAAYHLSRGKWRRAGGYVVAGHFWSRSLR